MRGLCLTTTLSIALTFLLLPCATHAALVNINTASSAELDTLPGIGASRAADIIAYRNANGPFTAIEDIMDVSGIGEGIFDDIKDLITVGAAPEEEDVEEEEEEPPETEVVEEKSEEESGGGTAARVRLFEEDPLGLRVAHAAQVSVGQPVQFVATPSGLGDSELRTLRYTFNFGDGMSSDERTPVHRYLHPGTYVVVVSAERARHEAAVRSEITVLPLALSLGVSADGALLLHNDTLFEADVSDVALRVGEETFVLPEGTYLLPRASLALYPEVTGFKSVSTAFAYAPDGDLLAHYPEEKDVPKTVVRAAAPIPEVAAAPPATEEFMASSSDVAAVSVPVEATNGNSAVLGFLGVLGLAILALYAHKLV